MVHTNNISKKIFLLFHGRFPSEKAASLFAAKSAEAFSEKGIDVTLVVPRRIGYKSKNYSLFYNIKDSFNVVYLPTIDLFNFPVIRAVAFYVSFLTFSLSAFFYLFIKAKKSDVVYSNESLPLLLATFILPNTFYELHDYPEGKFWFYSSLLKRCRWVLSTNKWKADDLKKTFSLPDKKIIVELNAVNVNQFSLDIPQEEARKELGLPLDKKIILYTGHLYGWKGADVLAGTAPLLGDDVSIIFVGGTSDAVAAYKTKYSDASNIKFVGFRPHEEIVLWQKSADVLVLPNTAKEKISKYYTSPMKLFEYMASGRIILASDLPSI